MTCVCVKSARGIAPRTASLLPVRVFASCATQRAPSLSIFILFFSYGAAVCDKLRIIPERACLHCVFFRRSGLANQNRLGSRCHAGFCESKNCLGVVPGDRTVFRETVEINSKTPPSLTKHSRPPHRGEILGIAIPTADRATSFVRNGKKVPVKLLPFCVCGRTPRGLDTHRRCAAEAARTNTRGFGAATPTAHTGKASGEVQTRAKRVGAATTTARETTTLVRESAVAFPNIE